MANTGYSLRFSLFTSPEVSRTFWLRHYLVHVNKIILLFILVCCNQSPGVASEGERLSVEVTGLNSKLSKNVEIFLSIVSAAKDGKSGILERFTGEKKEQQRPLLTEQKIRRLHRLAPDEIRQALQPFGYYEPVIDSKLNNVKDEWQARYSIDPGPAILLGKVEIVVNGPGGEEPAIINRLNSTELGSGQRLDHEKYESAKEGIADALYNAGYIDARFSRSELIVHLAERRADIHLIADSGPLYQFVPSQLYRISSILNLCRDFANFKRGDRFDSSRLLDFQIALTDSNYFSQVEIVAERDNAIGTEIPVIVKTEPKKPRHYTIGLGFGTDTGPRATAGAEFRRINKRGHKIRTDIRVSAIEQAINGQYLIPIKNIATDNLAFTGSASQEEVGDVDTNQFNIGVSLNENWLGFRRRIYLNLERENFDLGDGDQTSNLLIPGLQLSRISADDTLFPRKGYSATFDIHGGIESPLTETTFLHSSIGVRSVWPLAERGRLLFRGEYGFIQATSFSDLPPSQRFLPEEIRVFEAMVSNL